MHLKNKRKQSKKTRNQAQYQGRQTTQEVAMGIKPYCSHETQLRVNSKLFWKIENSERVYQEQQKVRPGYQHCNFCSQTNKDKNVGEGL